MTITETLRQRVEDDGENLLQISKSAGVSYSALHRFVKDKKHASGRLIDALGEYYALEVKPKGRKRKK